MTLLTEDYQARHPAAAAGMTRLRDIIGRRRAAAREVLTGDSGAERLRRFLADWRRYLDTRPQRALARATLLPESGRALRRVLAKFLRDARRLETPDYSEALHDLRKTGKKLRYLLESFRELFPVKELDRAVRRLRRLQASLGEIVDAHAQRAFLQGCLRELPATAEGDRRALERMAQRILQRGIDAGAVLPARLKALTGVRHAARLARQFETEP
jgi:CHAD domain-containing protein